jgi:hypothetical protein
VSKKIKNPVFAGDRVFYSIKLAAFVAGGWAET